MSYRKGVLGLPVGDLPCCGAYTDSSGDLLRVTVGFLKANWPSGESRASQIRFFGSQNSAAGWQDITVGYASCSHAGNGLVEAIDTSQSDANYYYHVYWIHLDAFNAVRGNALRLAELVQNTEDYGLYTGVDGAFIGLYSLAQGSPHIEISTCRLYPSTPPGWACAVKADWVDRGTYAVTVANAIPQVAFYCRQAVGTSCYSGTERASALFTMNCAGVQRPIISLHHTTT